VSAVAVTGWAALAAAGPDRRDVTAALRDGVPAAPMDVSALAGEVPGGLGYALTDFDPRSRLGRRGTFAVDRSGGLAMVVCGDALADGGLADAGHPERVGVVLGTSVGGLRATMEFSRQTLVNERPYQVSPAQFPTAVMNSAAGRVAIRYGLRGVNATVAGGRLAFLEALRFAQTALRRGHADALLVGVVEEYSAQHAWRTYRTGDGRVPAGEAAVVLAVQRPQDVAPAGRRPVAELLAVAVGFAPGGDDERAAALGGCALRCLERAGLPPGDVSLLATGELGDADRTEWAAVRRALGPDLAAERVLTVPVLGNCQAADGGLAFAGLLARAGPRPRFGLQTGRTATGAVGAALWSLPGDPSD
jgi:3-oxoacyl-[acyl-carrier-protein] synthase II